MFWLGQKVMKMTWRMLMMMFYSTNLIKYVIDQVGSVSTLIVSADIIVLEVCTACRTCTQRVDPFVGLGSREEMAEPSPTSGITLNFAAM
jgi:hypothetical protein